MTIYERFKEYMNGDEVLHRDLPLHENMLFLVICIIVTLGSIGFAVVCLITVPIWGIPYWLYHQRKDKNQKQ